MPDDQKSPGENPGLSKKFKEFAFGEEPAAPATNGPQTPAPKPAVLPPANPEPVKLTKEDMNFVPYRGMGNPIGSMDDMRIAEEEEEAWEERDWEQRQERTFEAAGAMFRHEREITDAMSQLSNLEMQSVIAAGLLLDQYHGLPKQRVNDMVIAALALNAANFDDICGDLTPETVGMVDELHRMTEEPDRAARLIQAASLETDSKRVLLATTIADLQMYMHEMHEEGDPGPTKEEQKIIAEMICALAPGVDKNLRHRAIDTFNLISVATDNGATLKEKPDGSLILNDMPDIVIEMEPDPKAPAPKKQRKPRK